MVHSKILPATMAVVFVLAATGAAFAATGESENNREIAAVLGAKTSLAQAIAAAEQRTGGHAMKIDVEKESGTYLYEVKTVSKNKVADVFIDPVSGQVVRTDNAGLIARLFDRDDQDELGKLAASPTTLVAAIAIAEQHIGGKAIEASVDHEHGAVRFEVAVAKDDTAHKVKIDGASGKILKVAPAEHGEHDGD